MEKIDIHNYKRQFENQLALVHKDENILIENKEWIVKFVNYLFSEGIGYAKIGRYLLDLRKFSKMLGKNFDKADKNDIRRVIAELNLTNLSEESKKAFKVLVRKLYVFVRGVDDKKDYPEEVRWISLAIHNNNRKLPEELLTEEEIKRLIQACDNIRDRALISLLCETGARVSEIGTMKIKHVSFERHGARLTVNGKTGPRKILVIWSQPYIQEWLNQHPKNSNSDAFLWYNPRGEILSYGRISAILKKFARRAGIKKRVHLHLLRHTQATHMAPIMSESAMKQYFGWTQGSKMAGIYVHMSGKDTDDAVLRANGVTIPKEIKKSNMEPISCLRCKTLNEATNLFCKVCGLILDKDAQKEIITKEYEKKDKELLLSSLLKDDEVLFLLRNKISLLKDGKKSTS